MIPKFLDPKNDFAFKKIFGTEQHKDILIHFLNDILSFRGKEAIRWVEFLSPVLDPEIAYKKQSIVDVLCRDANNTQYIIEMQVTKHKGFEQRAQFYAAKAYGRQAKAGAKYDSLKEVIFIAIADCILFPDKADYKSDHIILDRKTYEHDLKDFSFTFIELPKFNRTLGDPLETMVERWCYFFKYATQTHEADIAHIMGDHTVIREAYHVLDQHYWSDQEYLTYEQEEKYSRDREALLEQQLEDAHQKGEQRGLARGLERGLQKGIQEGEYKKSLDIAQKMLSKGVPLDEVEQITGLSKATLVTLC